MNRRLIAASAALIGGVDAFWRMECPGRVGLARIDPIVNFNDVSEHAHAIHGSSGISESSLTSDLLAGDCTSCRVTQDMSSYWHPAAYFKDEDTGEFELVDQVGGMLAYYLLNGENIKAFPADFRMLSGNSKRRTYSSGDPTEPDPDKSQWQSLKETDQDTLAERALGFNCLNYDEAPEATLYRHFLPDKEFLDANCAQGVRFEIVFPSCWDGENLDSDNHKDHVAFPDLVMTGTCPEGFPVRLPTLLYEVIWNTAAFKGRNGHFVLSNGDPTGYGYHADFLTGWEEDFLQEAVDTCTNESGRMEDCAVFNVVDEATAKSCEIAQLPNILQGEKVDLGMKLPGGVKITYEDGPAVEDVPPPPVKKPTDAPASPDSDDAPIPGQVFKESSVYEAAPSSTGIAIAAAQQKPSSIAEPPPPPPPPATTTKPEVVIDENKSYFSTEYVTNGKLVSKIYWEEEVVFVTEVADATVTVHPSDDADSSERRRRHAHLHGHLHNRHY